MNEIKLFNNPEFGEVRAVSINSEPWFVGKDVAQVLGYPRLPVPVKLQAPSQS